MSYLYWCATLLLIRHGQARASDGSYEKNTPLSEFGRLQAARVADALVLHCPPAVVYTSPYPRALATAAPLCQKLYVTPIVDPRLAEFELAANTFDSLQQRADLVIWHPAHRGVPDGETLGEFSARVAAFCDEVVERHREERIAVFAHAGVIDAALRWSVGLPADSLWQHEFDLANGSITEIECWPRGRIRDGAPRYAVLRRIGDRAHLGDLVSDL